MNNKIVFRADGNPTIGLGHLYRSLALANTASSKFDIVFAVRNETSRLLVEKMFRVITIPSHIPLNLEFNWMLDHFDPSKYLIVADGYQFDSNYQKNLVENGYRLIYIDDLAEELMCADLVINHSPGITSQDYKTSEGTQLALGTKFALVRSSFLNMAKKDRSFRSIDTVFLCFGGSDPYDLLYKATSAILSFKQIKKAHIVLGKDNGHSEFINLQNEHSERLNIHHQLSEKEMIDTMSLCNFGIVPSSTILYEICCIKMPILSGYFIDNQKYIYDGFLAQKAIIGAGDLKKYSINDFKDKIEKALTAKNLSHYMSAQKALFDSKIESRLLNLLIGLC